MSRPSALIDTTVVIALVAGAHEHHGPSFALVDGAPDCSFAVSAHSFAEAYATLTRASGPFAWPPEAALAALESVAAITRLVGLTPAQGLAAVRGFAAAGRTGPLLYDWLIGEAARLARLEAIVTWNLRHMRALCPDMSVMTPAEALAA